MTELEKTLTGVIESLTRQNESQSKQIESQSKQIESQSKQIEFMADELKAMREAFEKQTEQLEQSLGKKAGKAPCKSRSLRDKPEDKAEGSKPADKSPNKGPKPGGNKPRPPENCPEEVIEIDVLAHEKIDPDSKKPFAIIDVEERVRYVRTVNWKKITYRRNVYAGGTDYGMIRAPWPEQVLDNCCLEAESLSALFVRRTLEHLPFTRQAEILQREGFPITRQNLCESFIRCAEQLGPLYELLRQEILSQRAIHVDETFVKEKRKPGCNKADGKLKQCYLWFLCARAEQIAHQTLPPLQPVKSTVRPDQSLVYMEYAGDRGHENADIIGDFSGLLHSDCFKAYEDKARSGQFTWQPCLTHAAREFEGAPATPMNKGIVRQMKKIIKEDNKLMALDREERLRRRQEELKPLFEKLVKYLKDKQHFIAVQICEKSSKAFNYFLKRVDYFRNFLNNPDLLCDNNPAERGIRPTKIGMNNWLFFGSPRGGRAHAIAYSLLLTCRNIGVNAQEWLTYVLRNLPTTPKEELHLLLPHKWTPKSNPKSPYLPINYTC